MRSLLAPQVFRTVLLAATLLFSAASWEAQAQTPSKTQTKAKSKAKPRKGKGKAKTPEKAPPPAQEKAQAQEPEKAPAADKAQASEKEPAQKEPAQQKAQTPEKAPAPQKVVTPLKRPPPPKIVVPERPLSQVQAEERAQAKSQLRVGVALDLFTEKSRMAGEQAINASRTDESFDYGSSSFLSATLSMSIPAPIASDRARIGGGVRLFGNYGAGGDRTFGFGLLHEAFILGEYGLPVANKLEVMFGGRVGMALLIPGREFSREISRLQAQGVDVWSVPRVGWLGGLSAGVRRRMSEHILLRADLTGQLEKLYLFATNEEIEELEFNKSWSTFGLRLGLTLGAEFAL